MKVGDKIEILQDGLNSADVRIGNILTVGSINSDTLYAQGDNNWTWSFKIDSLDTGFKLVEDNVTVVDIPGAGKKFDQDKPKMSLVPQEALMEVARVMTFGAVKYGDHNWRAGMKWSRLMDANMRHLSQWCSGDPHDSESKISHLAHAAANTLMLLECELKKIGNDDRYE